MGFRKEAVALILTVVIAVSATVLCQQPAYGQEENVKVRAGENAPPFSVNTLKGQTVSLDDYQGRVLILEFFASWCHVCKNATPELRSVRENFSPDNLALLSVESSPGVPIENVRDFKSEYGGDWAFAKSPDMADNYGVEAYPTLFIIDPDGYVAFRNEGAVPSSVLSDVVADILGAPSPSGGPPEGNKPPSNMIIDVKVRPENAGGIVATNLRIKETGEPVFTYKAKANPSYKFAGWAGDVPENQKDNRTLEIVPTAGSQVTAKFTPLGSAQQPEKPGPASGVVGNFTILSFVLGAIPAGCIGALAGYLVWGRDKEEEKEG